MSNPNTVRLPKDLGHWLDEEARKTGLSKGRIVRVQLELTRTRKERRRFLDLAGSAEGSPDLSSKCGFER